MTKLNQVILVLALLLSNQNSSAGLKLEISERSEKQNSSAFALVKKTASDFWFSEEQFWKVVPREESIQLDFSLVSSQHGAQTLGNRIQLNVFSSKDDVEFLVKHELSHLFLAGQCPQVTNTFIHELYSYWRSGDYLRLLYGQSKLYSKADAFKELKNGRAFDGGKSIAVSRIINEIESTGKSKILITWFSDLFRKCNDPESLKTQNLWTDQVLALIQGSGSSSEDLNESGFLVFDGLANEVIESDGDWEKSRAVGSILKPFLISFFSDVKKNKKKRNSTEWECGEKNDLTWNYKKALNYSCNGFFLDTHLKPGELENYVRTLNGLTKNAYDTKRLNSADIIGLWPTLKLSLLEVAKIYDYILERDPETVSILKRTAVKGTLSEVPEARWFVENNIALKSGTTTKLDLTIESGYVVAVFNIGFAPKIAILYQSGQRPVDLLPELKRRVAKYVHYKDAQAQVQVLSAFNPNSIRLTCPTFISIDGRIWPHDSIDLHSKTIFNSRVTCLGSPFEVKSPDGVKRRLYGDLTFQKPANKIISPGGRSEKNVRAQMGSSIVLSTSESHYMKSVFFSESSDHRPELKKALLMVIKNNLRFWNSQNRPICDTTICQVFNLNYERVLSRDKKQINDLIMELGDRRIESKSWLEFSLGGTKVWQQKISSHKLADFINRDQISDVSGVKIKNEFEFSLANEVTFRRSCEELRSELKLRSCPETLVKTVDGDFMFEGKGEGHERGMSLTEANSMAIQGYNFDQILENYYKIKVIEANLNAK